jgi:hypothetical protein
MRKVHFIVLALLFQGCTCESNFHMGGGANSPTSDPAASSAPAATMAPAPAPAPLPAPMPAAATTTTTTTTTPGGTVAPMGPH